MRGIYNLYIPICGLLIAVLLFICFFSKKRVKNKETSIFSRLLIYSLIDSLIMCSIITIVIVYGNLSILKILNKIDYIMYILWTSNFFLYVYYISTKRSEKINEKYHFMFWLSTFFDIFLGLLVFILPVNVHTSNNLMYSDGPALLVIYIGCALYVLSIIFCILKNTKNIKNKKLLPLYALIPFMILVFVLNRYDQSIVIISAVLAYVDLIMYFTIENPDMKMINDMLDDMYSKHPLTYNIMLHSDQGWQYQMESYQENLKSHGII